MGVLDPRTTVLLAAAGAAWEAGAVSALGRSGLVVGKRCVDATDLLATTATGVGDVAVVSADLPGLDADLVRRLAGARVGVVAVVEPGAGAGAVERVRRLGVTEVLVEPTSEGIAAGVRSWVATQAADTGALVDQEAPLPDRHPLPTPTAGSAAEGDDTGRVVVVWGPTGAPGRTTVAVTIAAERASQGRPVVLLDADPYGSAVGQNLGVLDEVSGLLAAVRRVNDGTLTPEALAQCRRTVSPGLEVLTGLPRPDRWGEVRSGALAQVIEMAALHADVVVDAGFGLVDDRHQGRDRITLEALDSADVVVAVGGAEPVSLVRLARGLVDLGERGTVPHQVVVNRMRDSLGWTRKDLVGMVTGYVWDAAVSFVREDRDTVDRALSSGRSLVELGESRLRADLAEVTSAAFGS